MRTLATLLLVLTTLTAGAWGVQGHRLVADVAWDHLTPQTRAGVSALLGSESMADVASWPDTILGDFGQTGPWHYVNIPQTATTYDRERDCPHQPGIKPGSARDLWRDCVVDRIDWARSVLADPKRDTLDRGTALKFLIHFVGDLHQPFHALDTARGGNDIAITFFGSATCGKYPCNLHGIWDTSLLEHRQLSEAEYTKLLEAEIAAKKIEPGTESIADWAAESHALSVEAIVAPNTNVDAPYFDAHIKVVDTRLELAGLRLARILNQLFAQQ